MHSKLGELEYENMYFVIFLYLFCERFKIDPFAIATF